MPSYKLLFTAISFPWFIFLYSCSGNANTNAAPSQSAPSDTIIVKSISKVEDGLSDFYSRVYSYRWMLGNETLDFTILANERKADSSFGLQIIHEQAIPFQTALQRINAILPRLKEDFNLSKLTSFYFRSPINYPDLSNDISKEYEQKFGRKGISYQKLYPFLLGTKFNSRLNVFFKPLNKRVDRYGIEKFQLLNKKETSMWPPNADTSAYPDFFIDGLGFYVKLTSL